MSVGAGNSRDHDRIHEALQQSLIVFRRDLAKFDFRQRFEFVRKLLRGPRIVFLPETNDRNGASMSGGGLSLEGAFDGE